MSLKYNGTACAFYFLQDFYSRFSPANLKNKNESMLQVDGCRVKVYFWPGLWVRKKHKSKASYAHLNKRKQQENA